METRNQPNQSNLPDQTHAERPPLSHRCWSFASSSVTQSAPISVCNRSGISDRNEANGNQNANSLTARVSLANGAREPNGLPTPHSPRCAALEQPPGGEPALCRGRRLVARHLPRQSPLSISNRGGRGRRASAPDSGRLRCAFPHGNGRGCNTQPRGKSDPEKSREARREGTRQPANLPSPGGKQRFLHGNARTGVEFP